MPASPLAQPPVQPDGALPHLDTSLPRYSSYVPFRLNCARTRRAPGTSGARPHRLAGSIDAPCDSNRLGSRQNLVPSDQEERVLSGCWLVEPDWIWIRSTEDCSDLEQCGADHPSAHFIVVRRIESPGVSGCSRAGNGDPLAGSHGVERNIRRSESAAP